MKPELSLQPDPIVPVADGDNATLWPHGVNLRFNAGAIPYGRQRDETYYAKTGTWQRCTHSASGPHSKMTVCILYPGNETGGDESETLDARAG